MKVFDALQIRDTNSHNSTVVKIPDPTRPKRVIYKNTLDKAATLQLQGSLDRGFTVPVNICPITASASMTEYTYEWLTEPWQYLRLVATCSQAPTSGTLDSWIE